MRGLPAGEPSGQHLPPGAGQLSDRTVPTGDRHQQGFGRPGQLWPPAVGPVQIGRCQAHAAGEVPPRQLRCVQAVAQYATQPFGRDLARQTERPADVLMMDGDVKQRESALEGRGPTARASESPADRPGLSARRSPSRHSPRDQLSPHAFRWFRSSCDFNAGHVRCAASQIGSSSRTSTTATETGRDVMRRHAPSFHQVTDPTPGPTTTAGPTTTEGVGPSGPTPSVVTFERLWRSSARRASPGGRRPARHPCPGWPARSRRPGFALRDWPTTASRSRRGRATCPW